MHIKGALCRWRQKHSKRPDLIQATNIKVHFTNTRLEITAYIMTSVYCVAKMSTDVIMLTSRHQCILVQSPSAAYVNTNALLLI